MNVVGDLRQAVLEPHFACDGRRQLELRERFVLEIEIDEPWNDEHDEPQPETVPREG